MSQRYLRWMKCFALVTVLCLSAPGYAETEKENGPLGNLEPPPTGAIPGEEDEFLEDEDYGFDLPAGENLPEAKSPPPPPPPPPPVPNDAQPRTAKPLKTPPTNRRRSRTTPPPRPSRSTRPSRPSFRASKPTNEPKLTGGKTQANGSGPKLADYLKLDSSVKGLQVQNFDLQDRDIKDVVKLISKWTGKNFIIDTKVRGKITILGPSQVTLQEAYQAFLSALAANNLTTVQNGKFIRIIESADARRAPVKTYSGAFAPEDDQFITRIFQLNFINADEVQREFRDMTTRQGKLFAYEPTNSIIITDTGSNIARIKGILESLDVKSFETSLHVLPIKNGSAKNISEILDQIYGETKSSSSRRRSSFRRSNLERSRGGGIITKIIPEEVTNSLVVLANAAGIRKLKRLVGKLDVETTDTGRIHVYYCEYSKAKDLAETLAALSSGGSNRSTSRRRRSSSRRRSSNNSRSRSRSRGGPVTAELGEGVKITSDEATNALVIIANSADYQTIRRVIKKLDIPKLQVFVETAILEVNADKTDNWNINLATSGPSRVFQGGFIGDFSSLQQFITGAPPTAGTFIPGFIGGEFTNDLRIGDTVIPGVKTRTFMGLLNIISQNTETSVLSTPQIIALDNEEAVFKVKDIIPVLSSTTPLQQGSAALGQNIENLEAGIEIKLTPNINASSRMIRLEIEQSVDDFQSSAQIPANLRNTNRAKVSRITNTTVVVKDQNFVMLGGLMTDRVEEIVAKVPLLGDIPILGWLFKSKTWRKQKKNLIVLLRPRIIGTSIESATLIEDRFKRRDKFIEKNMAGDDFLKEKIDEIKGDVNAMRKRGETEKIFDYRNNEDDDPVKPGDESQIGNFTKSTNDKKKKEIFKKEEVDTLLAPEDPASVAKPGSGPDPGNLGEESSSAPGVSDGK